MDSDKMTSRSSLPIADLNAIEIDLGAFSLSEIGLIEQYQALPLFKRGKQMFVAISDSTVLSALNQSFNKTINAIIVDREVMNSKHTIERYDAARLAYILDHNKVAGRLIAEWLARYDYHAQDCILKKQHSHFF